MTTRRMLLQFDSRDIDEQGRITGTVDTEPLPLTQADLVMPTAVQSITFGPNLGVSFLDAMLGLADGIVHGGRPPVVLVAVFSQDWHGIRPPRSYSLQAVVRREDMGVTGLMMEPAAGYLFLHPVDERGVALPEIPNVIVPSTRIARLHVP